MVSRISLLILSLAAVIPHAHAQEGNYQGLHYATPAGWTSGEQNGQFLLAPSDMTEETAVVVVLYGAENLRGKSFENWFRDRMKRDLNPQVQVLQEGAPQSGGAGSLQTLSTGRTIQDASGGVRLQLYYAISDGQQAAAAMLVTASETALKKYMPPIQSLFGSMRFSAAAPAPGPAATPTPAPTPAKPGAATTPTPSLSTAASGAARTFQNVIYTVPPGWSVQENAGGLALSPQSGLQGDESLSLLILPGKVTSDLEQEFQATWQEMCSFLNAQSMHTVNGTMYDLQGVERSWSGWEFLRGEGGAFNDQRRYTMSVFLVKVNGRIERVVILGREVMVNFITTDASRNPRFTDTINEFLFSLRFANWQTPNFPEAKLTGGAITGVWSGISMFGGQLKTGTAAFFSDGSAWFGSGFPTYGFAGIKPHIDSGADPRRWGKYKFQGTSGVLTMPYGQIPLRLDADALVVTTNNTPHRFIRSYPHASPTLNGRYCFTNEPTCLTLSSNGQFRDEGAVRVLEHPVYPYPLSPESGQGTYEVHDHSLILRYAGGPEVRVALPGYFDRAKAQDPDPPEIVLSFNSDMLKKM
ncbi:MAG: hypothetical protein HY508_07645 [Acidobacteria bacterium]|nr:hypothetical protein [Acidobacteriota bacterium]